MIKSYLKDRLSAIVILIVCTGIFTIIFWLYSFPLKVILYGGLLCFIFIALLALIDFCKYIKKHKALERLTNCIDISIDLPITNNLIEKDYQKLISILYENTQQLLSKADNERTEMIDYYTLWVHQIKTPIAAMSMLLQESDDTINIKLNQELFKIEQYAEMVLQYLRMESISSDLKLKKYSIEGIVKQAVRKYASLFIHKKIRLTLGELDKNICTDEKWLVFVVEQILSNSLKYTKYGEINIYIENESLVIEDTGIGIDAEDLPQIFEKGFTGFNGRADKKSTGLGLYLCKKILGKLSHGISISSEVGKGTKVVIDFPPEDIIIE